MCDLMVGKRECAAGHILRIGHLSDVPHIKIRGIAQNPVRIDRRVDFRDFIIAAEGELISVFPRVGVKRLDHLFQFGKGLCGLKALRAMRS